MTELMLDGISRRYGAVQALAGVTLSLRGGEVHALMGENGAGKSTLIRVLAGLERPDTGRVLRDGVPLRLDRPEEAARAGLRFIHQELNVVPTLSVAENMGLHLPYPTRFGLMDWRALRAQAAAALARLGLHHIDPRAPMAALGAGDRMLTRIAATLIPDGGPPPVAYVMDEPTAALTGSEAERLFTVIRELKAAGAAVLYVSHRMAEVLALADRISVLRDGQLVGSTPREETDEARLIAGMTGRALSDLFPARPLPHARPALLTVQRLRAPGLGPVSLALAKGEILGLAGLSGAARTALLKALIGAQPWTGAALLDGRALPRTPAGAWAAGLAYIPPERRAEGLMLLRSIAENAALPHMTGLFPRRRAERASLAATARQVRLKARDMTQAVGELSGGNQQKVLFARALAGSPRVLLLDEPTRGVDVGARADIYRLIRSAADRGCAVILSSSDLPEVIGLSDRIALIDRGRIAALLPADGLTEEALLSRLYEAAA